MDGQTQVFGRVIEGYRVFKLIEKMQTVNEKPSPAVTVESGGVHSVKGIEKKK